MTSLGTSNSDESRDPRLRVFMNLQAFGDMPQSADGLKAIRDADYDGVQLGWQIDRAQLDEAREAGLECLTLHVGWGTETDDEAAALIAAILEASTQFSIPLYPETHRATIFQDPWRTVQFLQRFPELEFNGDFSHWYTGTEMVYGGFENKMEFFRPVLGRIGFLHGRIGNPGCMQVDVGDGSAEGRPYVAHFRALWTESFLGYLLRRPLSDRFCFTPELLGPEFYYARVFGGREESDRWEQSLVLVRIARECFAEARRRWEAPNQPA
jgi:hypothetical protein